jgi:hypothetical protein
LPRPKDSPSGTNHVFVSLLRLRENLVAHTSRSELNRQRFPGQISGSQYETAVGPRASIRRMFRILLHCLFSLSGYGSICVARDATLSLNYEVIILDSAT